MTNFTGQYAGVLLENNDQKIILQQRDIDPSIINSGKITTFGGAIEEGETPRQAAVRELEEECSIKINLEDLEDFGVYKKTKEVHGQDSVCHIFLLKNISPEKLKINEGTKYIIFNKEMTFENFNLSILAQQIVTDYFKKK